MRVLVEDVLFAVAVMLAGVVSVECMIETIGRFQP